MIVWSQKCQIGSLSRRHTYEPLCLVALRSVCFGMLQPHDSEAVSMFVVNAYHEITKYTNKKEQEMTSDDCHIYSLEFTLQDVIRKYNFKNGLPIRNLIPIDVLIDYITQNSQRSIFLHCDLIDEGQNFNEPKLMRWLESNPGFTVVEDKVGLNVGDCAREQLEEMFMEMILTENPQNAIIPLPYFINLLRHRFSTVNYELYELFFNCGFITFVMQTDLPTPVIASEGIVAWIKANNRLGIMKVKIDDRRVYEHVTILDEATYGGVDMRIQRESAVRLRAEGDFVQRLKEVLGEKKTWLNYPDIEAIMECPRGGFRAVHRAVQHAQHQGEPLAMERLNNQWYYGLRDENQALPPPPAEWLSNIL